MVSDGGRPVRIPESLSPSSDQVACALIRRFQGRSLGAQQMKVTHPVRACRYCRPKGKCARRTGLA